MNKDQLLKKRYRAEKRFKFYGLVSITLAILFVIFLVTLCLNIVALRVVKKYREKYE